MTPAGFTTDVSTSNVATTSYAVRFRPAGPWRFGPDSGARDRVDLICHSDTVFSALCAAMSQLGLREEWLQATARSEGPPAVRFSSFYPFQGDTLLIVPPRSLWPPAESTKVRYKAARFVPLSVVEALLADKAIDEDRWAVDGESECLVPHDRSGGPFRIALRSNAAVDRLATGNTAGHETACLEFARDAGLWTVVQFSDDDAAAQWDGACAQRTPVVGRLRLRRREIARLGSLGGPGVGALEPADSGDARRGRRMGLLAAIALYSI